MDRYGEWIMASEQTATTTTNRTTNTTATVSPGISTITSGGHVISNTMGPNYTYTGAIDVGSWSLQSLQSLQSSQCSLDTAEVLQLNGDKADIKINDVSLGETLKTIQERLNILVPNSKFENEWDELKKLGEQYRKLAAELEEKSRMWVVLKKTE
jgi:hypothetical protein